MLVLHGLPFPVFIITTSVLFQFRLFPSNTVRCCSTFVVVSILCRCKFPLSFCLLASGLVSLSNVLRAVAVIVTFLVFPLVSEAGLLSPVFSLCFPLILISVASRLLTVLLT